MNLLQKAFTILQHGKAAGRPILNTAEDYAKLALQKAL